MASKKHTKAQRARLKARKAEQEEQNARHIDKIAFRWQSHLNSRQWRLNLFSQQLKDFRMRWVVSRVGHIIDVAVITTGDAVEIASMGCNPYADDIEQIENNMIVKVARIVNPLIRIERSRMNALAMLRLFMPPRVDVDLLCIMSGSNDAGGVKYEYALANRKFTSTDDLYKYARELLALIGGNASGQIGFREMNVAFRN